MGKIRGYEMWRFPMAVVTWGSLSLRTPHIGDIGLLIFQWDILHASGEKNKLQLQKRWTPPKWLISTGKTEIKREIFGYPIFR
jgi:hypothetical protein